MSIDTAGSVEIKDNFDNLSEFYDSEELRFFLDSSRLMVQELDLVGVHNVLDLATGTGHTVFELAKELPDGHIVGIDISQSMLEKAELKKGQASNITFIKHDMEALDALNGKFDLITCSFGVYFVRNMVRLFESALNKLNKAGKFVLINFADESLTPYMGLFFSELSKMGLFTQELPLFSTQNEICVNNLKLAGFQNIKSIEKKMQYRIERAEEWWKVVWGIALRSFLMGMSAQNLRIFKQNHMEKIEGLINQGENEFKINVSIMIGEKI